jgi:hypothetical protein
LLVINQLFKRHCRASREEITLVGRIAAKIAPSKRGHRR